MFNRFRVSNDSQEASHKQKGCFSGLFSLLVVFVLLLIAFDFTTAFLVTLFVIPLVLIIQMWKRKKNWNKVLKILLTVLVVPVCLAFVAAGFSISMEQETDLADNDALVVTRNIPQQSQAPTEVAQNKITPSDTVPPTNVPTSIPSSSPVPTATPTNTPSPTPANTPTPTNSPTPVPTDTPMPTLKKGMKGDEVTQLQDRLFQLGYLEDTADGIYGDGTKEAVRAFQVRNDLPADGVAGEVTLTLLYSEKARAQVWVWIPTHGGTKYHNRSGCSKMVNPIKVTLEEAHKKGYEACGRCY